MCDPWLPQSISSLILSVFSSKEFETLANAVSIITCTPIAAKDVSDCQLLLMVLLTRNFFGQNFGDDSFPFNNRQKSFEEAQSFNKSPYLKQMQHIPSICCFLLWKSKNSLHSSPQWSFLKLIQLHFSLLLGSSAIAWREICLWLL